jgi:uncharacterized surface protein with fasciclin (FAS1) repeats
MKKRTFKMHLRGWWLAGAAAAAAGTFVACEDYDLDEKLPPGFGSTINSYLEDNNYKDFARLVKELGYEEALSGRSSKTMFVADDEAFARFYASNKWGVRSYDDLTLAQKKILLYSAMIDNSLQLMSLSSTTGSEGAVLGNCMRRATASSIYDTIPTIYPSEMPDNGSAWAYYRDRGKAIVCMKDASTAPVMFFVEKFLEKNRITNADIDFLFNHKTQRAAGDADVNGIPVAEANIRCANGFLHRVQDVLLPLDNMAEIIRTQSNTTLYSRMLERFSAPYYAGRDATNNYNMEYGTQIDSLFQKRYYSDRSQGGSALNTRPDGQAVEATLKFDPGWNSFFSDDPNTSDQNLAMQENMGVMLVPTDAALEAYWNEGTGKVLKDYYGTWDNVPDNVLSKLINNNMLNSLINSVPSKFDGIVNSTQDEMGITEADVDCVLLGCNGAIYLTNKVFSPTEYISVSFPALINKNMSILYWAIEQLNYGAYLNSLDSYYSLFIPDNEALLTYVDPVSYGDVETTLYKFYYKEDAASEDERVYATTWHYNMETGEVGDSIGEVTYKGSLTTRLQDVLDNHIVVGNIESGKHYYHTKNGGVVRVESAGGVITGVQGTYQMDHGTLIPIAPEDIYDESEEGNGKTYILRTEPLLTTRNSVSDLLAEHDEFSLFYQLLEGSELHETARNGATTGSQNGNISSLGNYNYTIYVPTNASLQALIDKGSLPTWDQIALLEDDPNVSEEQVEQMKATINEFLRYHIQDNAVYIDMDYGTGTGDTFSRKYETAIMNEESGKFYTITADVTPTSITLTDAMGNTRHVLTADDALYNLSAREYQISSGAIQTSAFTVVQLIDGPLFFK